MNEQFQFISLDELRTYVQTLKGKQRESKKILQLIENLKTLNELLNEGFNRDDIAFAVKRNIKLEHHICPVCGREIHVYKLSRYPNTCSVSCGNKNSTELRRKLSQERYGVDNPHQCQQFKDKYKKTMLERHGGYTFQSKSLLKKVAKTNMKRYGVTVAGASKELHNKNKITCLKKYGADHPWKVQDIREKCAQTCLKKYGSRTYNNIEKSKTTCRERYGVDNPTQCPYIRAKEQTRYEYNGINFDSSWEIAYYIWLTDNNIEFDFQPNCAIAYSYRRKTFYYHPDFKVGNDIIEIKGDQYFNKTRTRMICPYNKKLNGKFNAKFKCMIKNKVKILMKEDIQQYLDYVDQKYDKGYLKQFKRKSKKVQ